MTTITVTFDPPLPSDSPATFNSKAFDTLGDLNTWSSQANTVAGEINTNAANASTSAGTASTHATTASTHATTATTKAGEANASAVAAAASASSASTSAGTATTQAGIATTKAAEAAASAASIAPGSLLTAANPSYTGTLTGGTGVVNLGSGQFVKDANGSLQTVSTSAAAANFNSTHAAGGYISCQNNGTAIVFMGSALSLLGDTAADGVIRAQGALRFGSGGGYDRGRFDANGNFLVGTTSRISVEKFGVLVSGVSDQVQYLYASNAAYGATMQVVACARSATSDFNFSRYFANGAEVYQVQGNGNVRIAAGSTYGNLSDRKLKDNITDATPKLDDVMRLRVRNFTVKGDPSQTKYLGWIAQEFEEVFPGLVSETPDTEEVRKTREVKVPALDAVLDDKGNQLSPAVPASTKTEEYTERVDLGTVTKGIKESAMIAVLTKALQEQHAIVQSMQTQLDEQNTAMQLLAERLAALEAK